MLRGKLLSWNLSLTEDAEIKLLHLDINELILIGRERRRE